MRPKPRFWIAPFFFYEFACHYQCIAHDVLENAQETYKYTYVYLLIIMCVEFHDVRMQTKFRRSCLLLRIYTVDQASTIVTSFGFLF
jgi:hypothetical protein